MCMTLAEHVRTFGPACDPAACVLPRLEQILRQQMRRRQLLSAPPAYLGYPEYPTWSHPEAFGDLLADCYVYAVARRIVGLRNQLVVRADLDGLVTANVRNFLFERQRQNDRHGYATFGNVEQAVNALEERKELTVDRRGADRLGSSCVVRFRGDTSEPTAAAALKTVLDEMPGWSETLPHLTETTEDGQLWVAEFLRSLRARGVGAVRVSDLVSVLATRVRADWERRHAAPPGEVGYEGGDDELARVVRLVWPDTAAEDRDRWAALTSAVTERIARLEEPVLRDRLGDEFGALVRLIEAGNTPSQADLLRDLRLTRSTVSRDFARLREILEEIVAAPGTTGAENG